MTKRRHPLSTHGVITRAFDEAGGVDEVAVRLPHRTVKWLRAATDPDLEGRHAAKLTFEDVRALSGPDVLAFAQDLADRCGMKLVPMADGQGTPADLMGHGAGIMATAGKTISGLAEACADNVIDARERQMLLGLMLDLSRQLTDAMRAVGGALSETP